MVPNPSEEMKMKTIQELIATRIAEEQSDYNEHSEILEMLKTVEGKPLNRRTFTAKRLGDKFKFEMDCGMFYIVGPRGKHLIGYSSSECVSLKAFAGYDVCYGSAAMKRINQLTNLDVVRLQEIATKIEEHFTGLRKLFGDIERENLGAFENPIYYEMLDEVYKDPNGKFRLSELFWHRIR
jgi:hypothetical protein